MTHEPDVARTLAEVLDLADKVVTERLSDSELTQLKERIKRQVNYNQEVVLCPHCKKRIRLNNSGRVRMHVKGKMGSEECPGSDANPKVAKVVTVFSDAQ